MIQMTQHHVDTGPAFIRVINRGEKRLHAIVGMNVGIVDIAAFIIVRIFLQTGVDARFADVLLGDVGKVFFLPLVPIDQHQRLILLSMLCHEGAEERDDLAHQRQRDQGQGRGKPGRNRLKINDLVFWGDKFTLLGLVHLVDVTVIAGDQADDLIRIAGGLHGGKCSLVGGSAFILHGHLGTHDAVRILVLGLFERVQELTGTFDRFLHGDDRCSLGIFDILADSAILHRP